MFTRSTANYGFPQWLGKDHPDFVNDMNPAYKTIDDNLKQAQDDGAYSREQVTLLNEKTDKINENLEKIQQEQTGQGVVVANLQHQMDDNKNNIAKNAADILVLQADNHVIHGDIATLATKQNVIMDFSKTMSNKLYTVTATAADGTTWEGHMRMCGGILHLSLETKGNPLSLSAQEIAILTVSMPGFTAEHHNFIFETTSIYYPGFGAFGGDYATDSFGLRIRAEKETTISAIYISTTYIDDELVALSSAVQNLQNTEVIYID